VHDLQGKFNRLLLVGVGPTSRLRTAVDDPLRSRKLIENVL